MTLHIDSLPFDTCEVHDLKSGRCQDVTLFNTTEFGVVKSGLKLERGL